MERAHKDTHVEGEPGVRCAEEDLEILPLTKVFSEVGPAGFWCGSTLNGSIRIGVDFLLGQDIADVHCRLTQVPLDIHGVSRRFGDGKSEIESDTARDTAETDEEAPHIVDTLEVGHGRRTEDSVLVRGGEDECNKGRGCIGRSAQISR